MAARLVAVLGHEVIEAADQAEALAAVAAAEVDVALVDLFLGSDDGVVVATRLRDLRPQLRVLFMSGQGEVVGETPALPDGNSRFLEKPFTLPALAAALEALRAP